jgi:hypothetical protein
LRWPGGIIGVPEFGFTQSRRSTNQPLRNRQTALTDECLDFRA